MADNKRVKVWVQYFSNCKNLMLQWFDPETGKRHTMTSGTADPKQAEAKRVDLESDLNNNRYVAPGKMTSERFREVFEAEYVAPLRPNTRENYEDALNLFEWVSKPKRLDSITARTMSTFAAELRQTPPLAGGKGKAKDGRRGHAPSSIKVRLQFLRTAFRWAVEQGLMAKCPKFPSIKVPDRKPQPVAAEAFERMLAKAPDEQTRTYLLCGWLAGLRLSEAFLLEWEPTNQAPYVDLARNRIILPADIAKGSGTSGYPSTRSYGLPSRPCPGTAAASSGSSASGRVGAPSASPPCPTASSAWPGRLAFA